MVASVAKLEPGVAGKDIKEDGGTGAGKVCWVHKELLKCGVWVQMVNPELLESLQNWTSYCGLAQSCRDPR